MKKNSDNSSKTDSSTGSTSSPQVNSRLRQGSGGQAGQELRHQSEVKLSERKKKSAALPLTESDTQHILHELEVHQIELEMQNEELVQSRAQVEAGLLQYTDLYDFAPIGYFTLARDGAIHQVNLAGASLLGVERGALINRRFGVFVSVEFRSVFNAFLKKVFESQQKETCEVPLHKDGSAPLWIHVEAVREDGQREACRVVVSDVTERKRAEKVLKESEEKYRVLIETTSTGYLTLNAQGRVIDANKEYIRLTGYDTLDEILGRSVVEWTAPHDLERNAIEVKKCIERGYIRNLEIDYINRSEQITPIEINATVVGSGESVRILSLCRDITDRRRAEEVLHKSEERFRAIASNTPDHILMQDTDLRYTLVINPQLELTEADMIGKTDHDFLTQEDAEKITVLKRNVMETGKPVHAELPLRNLKGEIEYFDGSYIPQFDTAGKNNGLIGYFRNITERKQAEHNIEEMFNFEKLLSNIATLLVHVQPQQLSQEITNAQRLICEFLKLDLSSIYQPISESGPQLKLTYVYHRSEKLVIPEILIASEYFPWCEKELLSGNIPVVHSLNDLPAEAARDRKSWEFFGIKSSVMFPMLAGNGELLGTISFDAMRSERYFSDELINRLKLIAQLFANSIKRNKTEILLRQNETNLQQAQVIAGLGSYIMDIPTGIITASKVMNELLGIDEKYDHSIKGWIALILPEDRPMMVDLLQNKLIVLKQAIDTEYRIIRFNDKAQRWHHILGKLDLDANGVPIKLHCTIQDITERRKAEEELLQRMNELQRWQKVTEGREDRNMKLKAEVNRLLIRLGEPIRYPSQEDKTSKDQSDEVL